MHQDSARVPETKAFEKNSLDALAFKKHAVRPWRNWGWGEAAEHSDIGANEAKGPG